MINKPNFYTAMVSGGLVHPFSHEAKTAHYQDDMAFKLDALLDPGSFARHTCSVYIFAQVMGDKVFVILSVRHHYAPEKLTPDTGIIAKGFTWFMSGTAENGMKFSEYHAIYDLEGGK